jgi:UDPglucose--hexose-1-phosphate uridylyltransferase
VIVAAHRQTRPWTGEEVQPKTATLPAYDPACYLCPGNARVGGARNEPYTRTFVFDNDHPCVGAAAPAPPPPPHPFFRNSPAHGLARVVCFSPRHDLTLAEMPVEDIAGVVSLWQQQTHDMGRHPGVKYVHAFENKGEVVGVSNPHPHGQLYATNFVFKTIVGPAPARHRPWPRRRCDRCRGVRRPPDALRRPAHCRVRPLFRAVRI